MSDVKPIDHEPPIPPQNGTDLETITADIEHAFATELRLWIDRAENERQRGRRDAAAYVLSCLRKAAR